MTKTEKSKEHRKLIFQNIVGGLLVASCTIVLVPKVVNALSSYFYSKRPVNPDQTAEEDWGPEIVRKEEIKESEGDGNV